MRLGGGEYDGGDMAEWEARKLFLDAVAEVAPEVLNTLRTDVFPFYDSEEILTWRNVNSELEEALEGWGTKLNLNYDWVYQTALITLWAWYIVKPEALEEIANEWEHETGDYWMLTTNDERKISFNHAGWDPAGEEKGKFKKRIMAEFENYLENYMDNLENFVQERGMDKAPEIRNKEQFKWLAMWQVGDYSSFGEIAKAVNTSRQRVTLGIQRAAEKCGLPVPKGEEARAGASGQPPKKI